MDDLEDEAVGAGAELHGGDAVVLVALEVRAPLDVEADDGGVVGAGDVRDPGGDVVGVVGDESADVGGEEGDVVEVVRVVGELVIVDSYCHGCSAAA